MSRLVAAAMLVVLVVVALLALTGRKPLRDPSHRDWDGVPEVATDSHSLEKAAPLRPIDPDALLLDFVRQTQTGPLEARLAAIRIVAAQFPPDVWAELLVPLAEDEEAAIREEVAKWFLMTDRPDGSPLRALKRLAADEQAAPKLKIAAADMVTLLGRDPTVQVADAPEVKQYPPGRLIHDFDRVLTDLVAGAYEHPVAKKALGYILKKLKAARWNTSSVFSGHQYYAILYTGQAMYLSSEENWKQFFPPTRDFLIRAQNDGDGSWQGDGVGKTYGTSIALLTLQLPYKCLPILQR